MLEKKKGRRRELISGRMVANQFRSRDKTQLLFRAHPRGLSGWQPGCPPVQMLSARAEGVDNWPVGDESDAWPGKGVFESAPYREVTTFKICGEFLGAETNERSKKKSSQGSRDEPKIDQTGNDRRSRGSE